MAVGRGPGRPEGTELARLLVGLTPDVSGGVGEGAAGEAACAAAAAKPGAGWGGQGLGAFVGVGVLRLGIKPSADCNALPTAGAAGVVPGKRGLVNTGESPSIVPAAGDCARGRAEAAPGTAAAAMGVGVARSTALAMGADAGPGGHGHEAVQKGWASKFLSATARGR